MWLGDRAHAALLSLSLACVAGVAWARDTVVTAADQVQITVRGEAELTGPRTVTEAGEILLPHLGVVAVKGLTTTQIEERLVSLLSRYLKSPLVTVELLTAAPEQVFLYGAVRQPGPVDLKPGDRVLEVLGRSGGLAANADRQRATLQRGAGATPVALDLDALFRGDLTANRALKGGDTLFVPELVLGKVKVMGEVQNSPTELLRRDDLELTEAIGLAGGLKPTADRQKVRLVRRDLTEVVVDLDDPRAVRAARIEDGDVLFVPSNEDAKIVVLGGVTAPGRHPFKPGMTVTDAIAAAGGFRETTRVRRDRIQIVRASGTPLVIDLDRYFKGDRTQNIALSRGDTLFIDEKDPSRSRRRPGVGDVLSGLLLPAATVMYYLSR